jgi:cytochrome c oxidase subunit 3
MPTRIEPLAESFEDLEQQKEAATLGMWLFLATEVLFFGGLFLAYTVYRAAYPEAFASASKELSLFFGTLNTAVLLTSSWSMALAVHAAQAGRRRALLWSLAVTAVLGSMFLVVKGFEYSEDFRRHLLPSLQPGFSKLFFWLYYAMTLVHATHLVIGIGIISVIFWRALKDEFSATYFTPVELAGLYWHFVDLIWVFLYPLLYLIDRHR